MRRPDRSELAVVSLATFLSLAIRLAAVSPAVFPLNDGGLFYTMIEDLVSNHLMLPAFTTYNAAAIPFAYPPLAFYLYALLHLTTRLPLLGLMQYGPAVISSACVPAFYYLARDMLRSKPQAALASFIFSLLPRAFDWLIMGGGVTRSFGMLFALLAMRQAYLLFDRRSVRTFLPLTIFASLVVLSHPEASVHTVLSAGLFFLWRDRSRRGLLNGVLVAAAVLALTLPWWGSVIIAHGLNPFLAASTAARADSYNAFVGLFALFRFEFADEPFVTVLTVLGLIGVFLELARRRFLLPAWLFIMHTLEPRGGTLFMMIPLAMCAGLSLEQVLFPALSPKDPTAASGSIPENAGGDPWLQTLLERPWPRIFLGFVLTYGIMSAFATGLRIRQDFTLTPADLQGFAWVRDHASAQSRFALVTAELPLRDANSEWFPALTGRQSLGTVFGFEWIRSADFAGRIRRYQELQGCATQDAECLQVWSEQQRAPYDYVYIANPAGISSVPLAATLAVSTEFTQVFGSPTVAIFKPR